MPKRSSSVTVLAGLVAAVLPVLVVPPAFAANQSVQVQDNIFITPGVAVKPGESVTWTYPGSTDQHNVNFEDGAFTSPAAPSVGLWTATRTFAAEGAYRFYCQEHGLPGGKGMSGIVYVNATGTVPGTPPAASFTISPSSARVGQNVSFNATGARDLDGPIVRHEWDLDGDGTLETDTAEMPTTSQSYATAGVRNVTLRITDSQGQLSVTKRSLSVTGAIAPALVPPLPSAGSSLLPPSFATSKKTITVSRSGRFSYRFRAAAGLTGKISARSVAKVRVGAGRRRRVSLGTKRFTVPLSRTARVRWRLSSRTLRTLKRNRRIKFRVKVTLRNPAGLTRSGTTTLTLKRPKR